MTEDPEQVTSESLTRGFLFSDLRGYTDYVEAHGATAAADLLSRYRELARAAIQHFDGAEIKTEGDSFYVVFSSVSAAVRCGLGIVEGAAAASQEHPTAPIRVGIGIHAGETVEAEGGYVGSPVNIAARICAQAGAGEVLVSDTVRALTQSVLPVRFEAKGRRQLKGVAEPVALFAVTPVGEGWAGAASGRPSRRRRYAVLAGAALVLVLLAGGWYLTRAHAGLPTGPWTIGLDMPLTGKTAFRGVAAQNAVKLAIDGANAAGGIGGSQLVLDARDDAGADGNQDPAQGATNVTAMVADPKTIGVIGPSGSKVAESQIPITNEAGLLECSPSTTDPGLTKPRYGALDLRASNPDRINFVRLAPSDDIQGPALASFAFHDLDARTALVIDDSANGREIADQFQAAYEALGGQVTRRALNPGADPATVLDSLSDPTSPPGVVFFGGFTDTGAADVRNAMAASGHGSIPFLSWDGIAGGTGAEKGSFINLTGDAAVGSYMSAASIAPMKADFEARYRAAYGADPDGYTAAAYACTEVIMDALRDVAATGPSASALREAVRASAVDTAHTYPTVLGTLGFDANGDSTQQFVTFSRVDPSAAAGHGDWVVDKQQDYGPAP